MKPKKRKISEIYNTNQNVKKTVVKKVKNYLSYYNSITNIFSSFKLK